MKLVLIYWVVLLRCLALGFGMFEAMGVVVCLLLYLMCVYVFGCVNHCVGYCWVAQFVVF